MGQTVQKRQERAVCAGTSDRLQSIVKVKGFGRQHYQIVFRLELIAGDGFGPYREGFFRRFNDQSLGLNLAVACFARSRKVTSAPTLISRAPK